MKTTRGVLAGIMLAATVILACYACSLIENPQSAEKLLDQATSAILIEIDYAIDIRQTMYDREQDPRLKEEMLDLRKWRFYLEAGAEIGKDLIPLLSKPPQAEPPPGNP